MAPVLKTGVPKGTVGSNPTPSVAKNPDIARVLMRSFILRRLNPPRSIRVDEGF